MISEGREARLNLNIEPENGCPLKTEGCPLIDEVRRLKEACKRLQILSQVDSLTELFNFGYLLDALDKEMERTRRTSLSTSLIMLDLDHFKHINDSLGHEAGNIALKWSSNILRNNLRRIDIPCRYGGEEFAVILPGTSLSQAVLGAERLRNGLANLPVEIDNKTVRLTASFGVDAYDGREDITAEEFIERTDHFLLDAKAKGRNRVCYDESKVSVKTTEVSSEERESLLFTPQPDSYAAKGSN